MDSHLSRLSRAVATEVASLSHLGDELKESLAASVELSRESNAYGLKALGRLRVASDDADDALDLLRSSIRSATDEHRQLQAVSVAGDAERVHHARHLNEHLESLNDKLLVQSRLLNTTMREAGSHSLHALTLRLIGLPPQDAANSWIAQLRLDRTVEALCRGG